MPLIIGSAKSCDSGGVWAAFRSSPWFSAAALGGCYFLMSVPMVVYTRFDGGVAFIWGSSGLLLARLSQLPSRQWAYPVGACGVAIIVMATWFGMGMKAAPFMVFTNLGEPILAALLLRRIVDRSDHTDTVRGVVCFILVAGLLAPAVSGIAGSAVISTFARVPFGLNWLHWFAAHGLGALLVTPIASALMTGDVLQWKRGTGIARISTTLATLLIVAAVSIAVFSQNVLPILFLPMLPMVFATICGGRFGAIAGTVLLAVIGGIMTAYGSGPVHLLRASIGAQSFFLQAYLASAALLVLPVAALLKQREALLRRLLESEARYRGIADSLGDAVVDVSIDGMIRYASPAIVALTGLSPDDLIGRDVRCLVFEEDVAPVWDAHVNALASRGTAFTAQYRDPVLGSEKWFEVSIRAVVSPLGQALGVVGSIRDITARKMEERLLQYEAQTDVLTGLANRRAFQSMLDACLDGLSAGSGKGSLAIFDLDHFKAINDTYGHAAGDAVLAAVAGVAQGQLRTTDRIGRIGGEEFAILFVGMRLTDVSGPARRLQNAIRELRIPFGDAGSLTVTISMGLCELQPFDNLDQLMRRADRALYDAKRAGRDCLRYAA